MGDRHDVPGQRDAEGGVGAHVDEADADPLTGLGVEGGRRGRDAPVDEVVGVVDVPESPPSKGLVPTAVMPGIAPMPGIWAGRCVPLRWL